MPQGRPREVAIFCAEELRPSACVVADCLVVRGFSVSLETGVNARKALQLSLQSERRGLRVLCVPEALDRKTHRKLYEGLDGDLRRDLLVVPLETPRAVVEAIEARNGVKRSRPKRRYTKAYLCHPTIAESPTDGRRFLGYGLMAALGTAAAAVLVLVATSPSADTAASSPAPVRVAKEKPSMLIDDAVLGAAVSPESELDDQPAPRRWRKRAREVTRLQAELAAEREAVPEREEVIVIEEDDEPASAPIEVEATQPDASPRLVAPPTFGRGAPGLPARKSTAMPVDPFASNPVE